MAQENKPNFDKEQQVQDWLESIIAEDRLSDVIVGADKVRESLAGSESPEFKPPFPIDYLTRLGNLRAGEHVLGALTDGQLADLEIIKRKYANMVDIITYDDLLRRLDNILASLKRRRTDGLDATTLRRNRGAKAFNSLPR